jgi:hypothetical protein
MNKVSRVLTLKIRFNPKSISKVDNAIEVTNAKTDKLTKGPPNAKR